MFVLRYSFVVCFFFFWLVYLIWLYFSLFIVYLFLVVFFPFLFGMFSIYSFSRYLFELSFSCFLCLTRVPPAPYLLPCVFVACCAHVCHGHRACCQTTSTMHVATHATLFPMHVYIYIYIYVYTHVMLYYNITYYTMTCYDILQTHTIWYYIWRLLRHFCSDPVCPDPIRKLSD